MLDEFRRVVNGCQLGTSELYDDNPIPATNRSPATVLTWQLVAFIGLQSSQQLESSTACMLYSVYRGVTTRRRGQAGHMHMSSCVYVEEPFGVWSHFFCLSNRLSVMSILRAVSAARGKAECRKSHAVRLSWVGVIPSVLSDLEQSNQFWGGTSFPGTPRRVLGKTENRWALAGSWT
jgi:hypothetical protein